MVWDTLTIRQIAGNFEVLSLKLDPLLESLDTILLAAEVIHLREVDTRNRRIRSLAKPFNEEWVILFLGVILFLALPFFVKFPLCACLRLSLVDLG